MRQTTEEPRSSDLVSLSDEKQAVEVLTQSVLGLWEVVNNLTRLRPTRREEFRRSRPLRGALRAPSKHPRPARGAGRRCSGTDRRGSSRPIPAVSTRARSDRSAGAARRPRGRRARWHRLRGGERPRRLRGHGTRLRSRRGSRTRPSSADERFESAADPVRDARGGRADQEGLEPRREWTALDEPSLERTDRGESETGQEDAPEKGPVDPAGKEKLCEIGEQWKRSRADEGDEGGGSGAPRRWRLRAHPVLLGEHRLDPSLAVRRDHVDDAIQVGAGKSLGGKDLSYLLSLTSGIAARPDVLRRGERVPAAVAPPGFRGSCPPPC